MNPTHLITVFFVDGTHPFKFGTTEEASRRTAHKIFREGFLQTQSDHSLMYHSPNNIKKVEVRVLDK